jgi:aminoglycoside phosphotransferase (APT) family kinase protein
LNSSGADAAARTASAVADLVRAREPGASKVQVSGLEPLRGGNARRAWLLDVAWRVGGSDRREPAVLLLQEEAGQLESDVAAEFAVLQAVERGAVPAPKPLWLDAEGEILGFPGFVMSRLAGGSRLRELLDPSRSTQNQALALHLAEAAAALHGLPLDCVRESRLPSIRREEAALHQVRYWEAQFLEHRMEAHPILVDAFAWLRAHAPAAERVCIVHGDLRFGNILYEEDRLSGLLDWEMAHLGDPCEDLAWAYRPLWAPRPEPSFESFVAAYERVASLPLPAFNLYYYRLFSEVKHAVISLTGARAFAAGRTRRLRHADRMTWVPECLLEFQRLRRRGAP